MSATLKETLKTISKKLAPGITAQYRGGRIVFLVRTSRTTENGTFKVNLGTFLSVEAATKALYEWKLYNRMPAAGQFALEGNGSAVQQQLESMVQAAAAQEQQEREDKLATLQEYAEKLSDVGMEQILESVPFHELDASKDAAIANEDGTTTVVPASVVAAYFKRLQNT